MTSLERGKELEVGKSWKQNCQAGAIWRKKGFKNVVVRQISCYTIEIVGVPFQIKLKIIVKFVF